MFRVLGVFVVLLAVPALCAPKLAAAGFRAVELDPSVAEFYSDYFAEQLRASGVSVITRSDTATLLGFERQKQLMGCNEEASSCVAEIAGALGVTGLVSGSLAKLGNAYSVQVKILSAQDGHALYSASDRVEDDDALHHWFKERASDAASAMGVVAPRSAARVWVPAAVGAAALGVSGVSYLFAQQSYSRVKTGVYANHDALYSDARAGATEQWVSRIAAGAAIVSLAVSAVMFATEPKIEPSITVSPSTGGGSASVLVRF
ncbi:MAG: hypothetical protein ACJ790_09745 [Myxococcaceae bacterium]